MRSGRIANRIRSSWCSSRSNNNNSNSKGSSSSDRSCGTLWIPCRRHPVYAPSKFTSLLIASFNSPSPPPLSLKFPLSLQLTWSCSLCAAAPLLIYFSLSFSCYHALCVCACLLALRCYLTLLYVTLLSFFFCVVILCDTFVARFFLVNSRNIFFFFLNFECIAEIKYQVPL